MARLRTSRLASLGVLLFACLMAPAFAQERLTREVMFDIAAQSVEAALIEFSKQADVQVMVGGKLNGQKTEGVKGKLPVTEALSQLLKNTGLEYQTEGNNTVTIRSPSAAKTEAQVTPLVNGMTMARREAEREASSSDSSQETPSTPNVEPLDEIVVTGSRLRRTAPGAITVFDRAKIDSLGASTIPDVLKFLPQQPYRREEGFLGSGSQSIELRGLGVDSTLVLVNGRRTVASAVNLTSNAFDLNTIPLAAVDRIEVLSDSASAVYGADAMGGVLNIIMKREISAPVLEFSYGSAEGGADERRVSLSAGHASERLRTSLVVDYFDRSALLGEERSRWRNQDFTRFGGQDLRSTTANPGNVSSITGDNLPGLSAPFAAVPAGSSGVGLTPADFSPTAGQQNLASTLSYWAIVPEAERKSAAGFGEFDVTEALTVFAEALYSRRETVSRSEPASLFFQEVPAENAFNPFGEPVLVDYLFTGLPPMVLHYDADVTRGAVGLRGKLDAWDWELSAMRSTEDASSWTENEIDFVRVMESLASSDPTQALNVFQDGPGGSPELLRSLVAERHIDHFSSNGTLASGHLRGSLATLPAGSVEVVVGAEWRQEEILFNSFTFVAADRDVSAAFAELQLPLIASSMRMPLAQRLSLGIAARYDEYSDFGNSFNPQYSLSWTPLANLDIRLSYGSAFRAPSLFELYALRTSVPNIIQDPRRGGEITPHTLITGGNPDLKPIEADSFSAGFVAEPSLLPGLRFSSTYWRITLDDRVVLFSPQLILANEDRFPERVVRAVPTPADVAAGMPGPILSIDSSRINFGRLETSGVDFNLAYTIDTPQGQFTPSLSGTWVEKYESSDTPNGPLRQRVDVANFFGTISRLQLVGSLAWSSRIAEASISARYRPTYNDAVFTGALTGREIEAQTLVDLQGVLHLGELAGKRYGWLEGAKLSAGVSNLLDEEAPFAEINGPAGYDRSQGDLRQRFGYIRLTKMF